MCQKYLQYKIDLHNMITEKIEAVKDCIEDDEQPSQFQHLEREYLIGKLQGYEEILKTIYLK